MKTKSLGKVKIWISSKEYVEVSKETNLRLAFKGKFQKIYNGASQIFHCQGLGTCGTCAVLIEGSVSKPTQIEKWRLSFPPHKNSLDRGLQLACQTQVLGDIKMTKLKGFWGHKKA